MLHPKKAPSGWKPSTKKLQTFTISPSALKLMALTELSNLDNLHMLNSNISARIGTCHFSHLENVWHIDSGASNHITQDHAKFSDYHLFSFKQIFCTGGGSVEVKRYDLVLRNWITQNEERVPVVFTNVFHVPGIITNLISVRKLDLKGIYWHSDHQTFTRC